MNKNVTANCKSSQLVVRDAKTGRFVTVRGAGALEGKTFAIQKRIDLTKPIASQALKTTGSRAGKAAV